MKEVIQRILFKRHSQKCNLKKETLSPSKTTEEQTNLAFRYTIPPSSDELKTNRHERLAFNRATTIAQTNLQTPARHVAKEGGQSKIYC